MKKFFFLFIACVLITINSHAQVAGYIFSQATSTYTEITGGTILGDTMIDEQRFVDPAVPLGGTALTGPGLPIGFNFIYNGNIYNVFAVNTNGWISFGQSTLTPNPVDMTSTSYILPISTTSAAPAVLQNRLSLFGRNIAAQFGSDLEYETVGTAPDRTLIIQWKHFRRNTQRGEDFNFQIKLYETTNVIEFVYGAVTVNANNATAPQIGLRGATNTDFNNRTTTTDWGATTAGSVYTASVTISLTVFPTPGLIYRWTPPVVYQYDAGITAINSPTGSVAPGSNNMTVTVKNYGTSALTSASIGWKVDGATQAPFTYSNAGLAQNATDGPFQIGTCNITATGNHSIKVWTSNPDNNTDQNLVNDTATQIVYVQSYGTIPYLQHFDNIWTSKLATDDAPDQYWLNTPATGNNSWRRDDDGASATWTGTGGVYTPAGANSTVHSARFHTNGTVSGTTGTLDLFLDFSPVGAKLLKFWNINTGGTDSLLVYMSTDGGTTFSVLQTYNIVSAWTQQQIALGSSVSPTVVLRFVGKSNAGQSDIGLDEIKVTILSPNDAGVVSIDSPGLMVSGNTSVAVSVLNFGTDSLKTASIRWSVNGATQSPVAYTNTPGLPPDSTDGPIAIGTYNFNTGGYYTIKAWTALPNSGMDGDNVNDTTTKTVYVQSYAPLPFIEDFDNAWVNKFNTRDVPSLYWTNTPLTGNDSWRRDDDGATAVWTQPTGGAYTPAGANGTAHSARLHTFYATAGDISKVDLYLDFTTMGTKMLKFWHINPTGTDSLGVFLSLDSGATFSLLQKFDTSSVWVEHIINLGNSSASGAVLRFEAVSDYGNDDIGIDRVQVYIPTANDVGVTQLLSPVNSICGSTSNPVIVVITNNGNASQTNIPVVAHITTPGSPVTLNATLPGPLAAYASDTLLVGLFNTTAAGSYSYTVYTNLATDAVHSNDTVYTTTTIPAILSIPNIEDFETTTPLADWTTNFTTGNTHGNTSYVMYRSLSNANPTGTASMNKKVGQVDAHTAFGFNYRIVSGPTGNATTLHTDSVFIYISSDCGVTKNMVYLIDSTNHVVSNLMKHITIPLTSYIGDDLIPSINAKRGNTANYYLDFDDVDFYELPVADAGPALSVCYLDTLSIVSANASNYNSIYWTTSGDGTFLDNTLQNPKYVPGAYDITNGMVGLTLYAVGNWDTTASVVTVTITTAPTAEAGNNVAICQGESTQLTASGGTVYVWSPSLGLSNSNIANPLASPSVTTTYMVSVTSSCGNATDNVTVTVNPFTQPNIGNNDTLCGNTNITLDAGAGYDSYLWSTGATTQTLYVDTVGIGLGTFQYWVDVTKGSCSGSDTVTIIFIGCSGIVEYGGNTTVMIYPNPSNGKTNFVVEGLSTKADLTIFNVEGQLVYRNWINGNSTTQLDLRYLLKGIYFVRIINDKTNILSKLIIQ